MASDINSVILVGRLVRDAELKFTQSGTAIMRFSIASNFYAGKENDEGVSYIDIDLWGKQAEAIERYMVKGKRVCVDGEIRQERWEKDGNARSKVFVKADRVQLLDGGEDRNEQPKRTEAKEFHRDRSEYKKPVPPPPVQGGFPGPEQFDDDIPF
jgi:single-strand DNA-binding protein